LEGKLTINIDDFSGFIAYLCVGSGGLGRLGGLCYYYDNVRLKDMVIEDDQNITSH
jgi:hypothetical protein